MLRFDGVSDVLDNTPTMDLGSGDLTIMAWVRILAFNATTFAAAPNTNGGVVFTTRFIGTNRSPTLCYTLVSGTRRLIFCHDTDAVAVGASGATALSLSTVYHFTGTFLSTNVGTFRGSWNCYLNGVQDNAAANNFSLAGAAILPHTGTNWDIAHGNLWPDSESNNEIWDLRVYQRLLSANEILTVYNTRGHDGIVNGLVGRWAYNELGESTAAVAGSVRDISPSQWPTSVVTSDPLYFGSPASKRRKHI